MCTLTEADVFLSGQCSLFRLMVRTHNIDRAWLRKKRLRIMFLKACDKDSDESTRWGVSRLSWALTGVGSGVAVRALFASSSLAAFGSFPETPKPFNSCISW